MQLGAISYRCSSRYFSSCFGVWLLDNVLRVDDPVGAVAVHMMNGIWGTIAVGLFATNSAPGYSIADSKGNELVGLFYGGGFKLLGLQLTGFVSVAAWTVVTITIVFLVIKATLGLRVSEEEEIIGLDPTEHGLPSAYAGFAIMDVSGDVMDVNENTDLGSSEYATASQGKEGCSSACCKCNNTGFSKRYPQGCYYFKAYKVRQAS